MPTTQAVCASAKAHASAPRHKRAHRLCCQRRNRARRVLTNKPAPGAHLRLRDALRERVWEDVRERERERDRDRLRDRLAVALADCGAA